MTCWFSGCLLSVIYKYYNTRARDKLFCLTPPIAGWMVDLQMYVRGLNPQNLWMWPYWGKRAFADVLKLKDLEMRPSWIIWMVPWSNEKYCYKRQKRRHRHREGDRVKMEAKVGMRQPQAKELPGATRGSSERQGTILLQPLEGVQLCWHLDFVFLAF